MVRVIQTVADLQGETVKDFSKRADPKNILVCEPKYFDVVDVKNPHMQGQIGNVNRNLAHSHWKEMTDVMQKAGSKVFQLPPTPGLEDMVFTANPVLPGLTLQNEKIVLLSNMRHPSRKKEVAAYEKWFLDQGYKVFRLSDSSWNFEGQGDALWHPGRRLLWGGYGFRTVPEVYAEISKIFETPIVTLELRKDHFYHLDTCLCPLSETEALYYPTAFSKEGLGLLQALFSDLIEVNEKEALTGFACNAMPLGKQVLIQKGNTKTNEALSKRGYTPVELDTSEFIKSGGSVFCMKMMVY